LGRTRAKAAIRGKEREGLMGALSSDSAKAAQVTDGKS
jgi:hypothetical protein